MASPANAALCALIASAFWTFLGYGVGRRLLPRSLALSASPVLGWAVHSAALLPIVVWTGFSPLIVGLIGVGCIALAAFSLSRPVPASRAEPMLTVSSWAFALAAILAVVPAVAILPKFSGDAVYVADPIFDHAKIAIVDAMARLGLPPVNPVFSEVGIPDRLAYYYLWHFSAAAMALTLGTSGWEADVGLTWFSAFASLVLMMGLAVWLSRRSRAAIWVVALAAAGSLWRALDWAVRADDLSPFLWPPVGMGGWLFQATWVPQHLMAASCSVTALLLVTRYVRRQSWALLPTLVLVVVAAFESSAFVGGIAFALASMVAAPVLFAATCPAERWRVAVGLAIAALLVVCFITPFLLDQLTALRARADGSPIVVAPYAVFGELFPNWLRRLADVPGYWLIILPIELPAAYFAGLVGLMAALRSALPQAEKLAVAALACLAGTGLVISWLLASTFSGNNDLGLRAIIPAEIILIVSAATMLTMTPRRVGITVTALAGLALSLPDTAKIIGDNIAGKPKPDGRVFAQAPELWATVRQYAAPGARVANNPLYLKDLTPWPVNLSWALLANRSSCFAGIELAIPFAPLPPKRREAIEEQFVRVFEGQGAPEDVNSMALQYGCEVVVVVPQDGAWTRDPFASGPQYHLAESRDGRWRIYVRARNGQFVP